MVREDVRALFDRHVARHGLLSGSIKDAFYAGFNRGEVSAKDLGRLGSALLETSARLKSQESAKATLARLLARTESEPDPKRALTQLMHGLNQLLSDGPQSGPSGPSPGSMGGRPSPSVTAPDVHPGAKLDDVGARRFRDILSEQWRNRPSRNGRPIWKDPQIFDQKRGFSGFEIHGSSSTFTQGSRRSGVLLMGDTGTGKSHIWAHLLAHHDHEALADDCTNVLFHGAEARIFAPPSDVRTRERGMFADRSKRSRESMPVDEAESGRTVNYVFVLHPHEGPVKIEPFSKESFARHVSKMVYTMFPTYFGDERTLNSETWAGMPESDRQDVGRNIANGLASRGVHFFKVNVPVRMDSQKKPTPYISADVAAAVQQFLKGRGGLNA